MNLSKSFNYSIAETTTPLWIWGPLAFSAFYFLPVIAQFQQFSLSQLNIIIAIYLAFIALYRQAAYSKGDKIIPWLVALITLISLSTTVNYGSNALFGYCAFIASFTLSMKRSVLALFVITCAILLSGYFFAKANPYFFMPALFITYGLWVLGQSTRKDAIHRLKERKSQQTIEQLAATAERERIARDLHDLVGHSLSSIALKAELAEKYLSADKPALAQTEISEVAALSREILSEVRHAVSGMKKQNIASCLNRLTEELSQQGFSVSLANHLPSLSKALESTIALILIEACTNILRHSNGDKVSLTLNCQPNDNERGIELVIYDNGQSKCFEQGNGLQGITERCQQLNGKLDIDNSQGFTLTITLPYSSNQKDT